MNSLSRTTQIRLPREAVAKNGRRFVVQLLRPDAEAGLMDMYLAYRPRNSFQGLPPLKDAVCVQWVREMLRTGRHVIAESDRAVVGHAALFPINRQKCEMLVVVRPEFQNIGIGTELVQACVALAGDLDFERIWLPVEATNVRARHVYQKCGFEYESKPLDREVNMVRRVRCCREDSAAAKPTCIPPPVFTPRLESFPPIDVLM